MGSDRKRNDSNDTQGSHLWTGYMGMKCAEASILEEGQVWGEAGKKTEDEVSFTRFHWNLQQKCQAGNWLVG